MQVGPYQQPYDDRRPSSANYEHRGSSAGYYGASGGYDDRAQSHDRRRSRDDYNESSRGYDERSRDYDDDDRDRASGHSHSQRDRGEKHESGGKGKDIAATVAGGLVGAFAGHEVGHGGIATLIGAAAGAFGGHELEKKREHKKEEKRRESQSHSSRHYSRDDGRSSVSGGGSREIQYSDPYGGDGRDGGSDSDYDRRRHHHHHHD